MIIDIMYISANMLAAIMFFSLGTAVFVFERRNRSIDSRYGNNSLIAQVITLTSCGVLISSIAICSLFEAMGKHI